MKLAEGKLLEFFRRYYLLNPSATMVTDLRPFFRSVYVFGLVLCAFIFLLVPSLTKAALVPLEGGMVSLTFDDGWLSTYQTVVPLLNEKDFKGTFYIYSDAMHGASQAENTWEGFMNTAQVVGLDDQGHEIGAHSRSHSDLSAAGVNLVEEIAGNKSDLLAVGVNSVTTFAYPYGAYNNQIVSALQDAGFVGARSTDDDVGYNTENTNPYILQIKRVTKDTTISEMHGWIDEARASNRWLVVMFHEVTRTPSQCLGGDDECASVSLASSMIEYLDTTDTCVQTVAAVLGGTRCTDTLPPPPPPPTDDETTPPPPPPSDDEVTPPPPPTDSGTRRGSIPRTPAQLDKTLNVNRDPGVLHMGRLGAYIKK